MERATAEAPLAYSAVRGGIWVALSAYWTLAFGFIANIFLTRMLPPEAFGVFALAMFFAQLLRLQTKLGLGQAFGQHRESTGEAVATYVMLEAGLGLGGLLLFVLAVPLLRGLGYAPEVVTVAAALAISAAVEGIGNVGAVLMEKELRFAPVSLVQSLAFSLSYIPAFWLAFHGAGVWSLVAQNAAYNLLSLVGIAGLVWPRLHPVWQGRGRFDPSLALRFLRFGATVGLGLLAGMLFAQLDNFFIGTFVGVTALGFYDRAYRIAQWPGILFNAVLARTAFYTYARLQEDRERLRRAAAMVMWLIAMVALPASVMLFIIAPDLIVLLYGERWLPSAWFARILILIFIARPFWEHAGTLFIGLGKPEITARFTMVQALVLAITGLPLTLIWGAVGTCLAVGLASAIGVLWIYHHLQRELSLRPWSILGGPVLAAGLTVAGYGALGRLMEPDRVALWARVVVQAGYAVVAFAALNLLIRPRETCDRLRYVWRLALRRE